MTESAQDDNLKYVIMLKAVPGARLSRELHKAHAEHLRKLDEQRRLVLAGPYLEHNSGIIIVTAESKEEAIRVADADPFIREGYREYEVRTLEVCCRENNYRSPQ